MQTIYKSFGILKFESKQSLNISLPWNFHSKDIVFFARKKRSYIAVQKYKYSTVLQVYNSRATMSITWSCQMHAPSPFAFAFLFPGLAALPLALIRTCIQVKFTDRNRSGYRGNRSNRFGSVPIWGGYKPVQIQNLNLNSKNEKNLKILQVATNLMVSIFFKNSSI